MRLTPWALLFALFFSATFLHAECVNDHRSHKNAGILINDFTISGTQTMGATELARITSDLIDSCFDEDSEELEERIRASFQERGYFAAEVKTMRFKPADPLGVPKSVTLEAEVSEGLRHRLGRIGFVDNHAFDVATLRQEFSLKTGDVFERDKIARGLEDLRRVYGSDGFLDFIAIPDTQLGSNGIVVLTISVTEGPQYHMGKLEILAPKEAAARLRAEWKLAEGDVYDQTYIDQYLEANRDLLPVGFSRANVQGIQNCPDAVVEVRLIIDPTEDTSHAEPKNVHCEEHHDVSK